MEWTLATTGRARTALPRLGEVQQRAEGTSHAEVQGLNLRPKGPPKSSVFASSRRPPTWLLEHSIRGFLVEEIKLLQGPKRQLEGLPPLTRARAAFSR